MVYSRATTSAMAERVAVGFLGAAVFALVCWVGIVTGATDGQPHQRKPREQGEGKSMDHLSAGSGRYGIGVW